MFEEQMTAADVLRNHQRQLDQDGVIVGVSRQAIDEVLTELETLRKSRRAVLTLESAQGQELKLLREQRREEWGATQTLDSEREANAILTAERETLLTAVREMATALAELDRVYETGDFETEFRPALDLSRTTLSKYSDLLGDA